MVYTNENSKKTMESVFSQNLNFSLHKNKIILITGGTGLVGSVLVDMLSSLEEKFDLKLFLVLVSRNRKSFEEKFAERKNIKFIEHDMTKAFEYDGLIDYAIHLAANTHPVAYVSNPVGTIETNFLGTKSILELCRKNSNSRFVNISSVEIYRENKSNKFKFDKTDFGYIDCNTFRAWYNESKRLSETLYQAYKTQYGVDFVTARLCRCCGPTLRKDDSKALSQFLFRALNGDKKQRRTIFFVYRFFSAVTAIIFIMLKGESGEVYNIADEK